MLLGLTYCGYAKGKYLPPASRAVDQFHARLNHGQDDIIYDEADMAWKSAIDKSTEEKFFSRIRRKLGACRYTGPLGWQVNSNTTGVFVSLTYRATCSNGIILENFVWRNDSGMLKLYRYNANSKALLTD